MWEENKPALLTKIKPRIRQSATHTNPFARYSMQSFKKKKKKKAFSPWTLKSIYSSIHAIKLSIREGIQGEREFLLLISDKYWIGFVLHACDGKPYFPTIMWSWCWTSEHTLAVTVVASWSWEFWSVSIICCSWPITGSRASWSRCFLFLMCVSSCWMSAGECSHYILVKNARELY